MLRGMVLMLVVLFLMCEVELTPCEEHDDDEGYYKYPFHTFTI